MKQQDIVEIVGAFVAMTLFIRIMCVIGDAYHLPRMVGAIVCGGLSGFAAGELRRRVKARRRQPLDAREP